MATLHTISASEDPARVAIILGIDPGYDRCGIAVIRHMVGAHETLTHSSCTPTKRNTPFEDRLLEIGQTVSRYIETYKPSVCAIENVYFTTNQKTAMRVAEVRGACLYIARSHGLAIHEFTPNEVKVAIAGDGRADKKQVIHMVSKLVRIEKAIVYDDEYDAIAVALTAAATRSSCKAH